MDDLTIGGPESAVAADVNMVRIKGDEIGLRLNSKKCEFIGNSAQPSDPAFKDFVCLTVDIAELLGAPLTTGMAMDQALNRSCDDLERAAGRLRLLAAHDAPIQGRREGGGRQGSCPGPRDAKGAPQGPHIF